MKTHFPEAILNQHIGVVGKTGSGKTSTAKLLVEQVSAGARVCVLDPIKSDWWGLISSADGKKAGLPFNIIGGPRGHVPLHAAAGAAIGTIVGSGALPLSIIDMADFAPGEHARFFIDFAHQLFRSQRGVLYLVVEEAHMFAPKEKAGFGDENKSTHWMNRIATGGRSKGIRLVVCTQRTQALHNAVLGSCETVIAHRLTLPADQKPVIDWLKANADRETMIAVSESISSLTTGEGWVCSGEARIFKRKKFERIATFDNSATPTDDVVRNVKTVEVDHAYLRSVIGDAVKEAEGNDPKLLKAEIAKLKKELATAGKNATVETKGVSVLTENDRFYLSETAKRLNDKNNVIGAHIEQLHNILETFSIDIKELKDVHSHSERIVAGLQNNSASDKKQIIKGSPSYHAQRILPAKITSPKTTTTPSTESSVITTPQGKILDSLAWLRHKGVYPAQKETLAAVCGVSPRSGGYFNNLGKLRSAGLIEYPSPGTVELTPAGDSAASFVDDGRDLAECWLGIVTGPQRKILNALIAEHPNAVTKSGLAAMVGVSETSGGYFNNLGKLRTLGAIDYPSKGFVGLTKHVMP